jgi:hypothetical protein
MTAASEALRLKPDPDVVSCELQGSTALLNLRTSNYYSLNSSGALVWTGIEAALSFSQIVDRFVETYGLDRKDAEQDITHLLTQFREQELVLPSDEPA